MYSFLSRRSYLSDPLLWYDPFALSALVFLQNDRIKNIHVYKKVIDINFIGNIFTITQFFATCIQYYKNTKTAQLLILDFEY